MASSVFFKFKSQREPSRVSFDGTGISVFELKREIINKSRLGDGTDFELAIYNEDTSEEYLDDTTIIPRSTSVVARRYPAVRPGKGSAARYVSGRMPVEARNSGRTDPLLADQSNDRAGIPSELDSTRSEDEKIKALFNLQESQWKEQQQEMSSAVPVPSSRGRGKPINVPDHPPPPGYLCYRCREKGHWIQACPTNNDPRFDGRYRVKRSTGIPRSFQKQVDKPDTLVVDGSTEHSKLSGVMVNADGDFVIAQPDKASWELYQEKANASAAAAAELAINEENKELERRGLLCPIDKRVLLAPTRTPCCQTTYCHDCISNALIESDFLCPGCNTEGVLLDDLTVDDSAISKLKAYEAEKSLQNKDSNKELSHTDPNQVRLNTTTEHGIKPSSEETNVSRKRPAAEADEQDEVKQKVNEPEVKKQKAQDMPISVPPSNNDGQNTFASHSFNQLPITSVSGPQFANFHGHATVINSLGFSGPDYFPSQSPWTQSAGVGFLAQQTSAYPNGVAHSMTSAYGRTCNPPIGDPYFPHNGLESQPNPSGAAAFTNQQRTTFSAPFGKEEENAYFRQPVNPHRHQARQRRIRPSDYREL
ncbi:hypothetical protein VTO42DRAFT_2578 [Malbranchea cinnamomea]